MLNQVDALNDFREQVSYGKQRVADGSLRMVCTVDVSEILHRNDQLRQPFPFYDEQIVLRPIVPSMVNNNIGKNEIRVTPIASSYTCENLPHLPSAAVFAVDVPGGMPICPNAKSRQPTAEILQTLGKRGIVCLRPSQSVDSTLPMTQWRKPYLLSNLVGGPEIVERCNVVDTPSPALQTNEEPR